jgi:glycosyltransferase involved in cell wall biosynthesis
MACGCAAVSTDCGGPSDFIESGVNGFLVPVGNAGALVKRILQLLQDPLLRKRFVAASQPVLARLTWSAAIQAYESALRSIVDGIAGDAGPIPTTNRGGV